MLKLLGTMCAALTAALVVCSAPVQARGGAHFGGAHFSGGHYAGGTHFGGVRTVGVGGPYYGSRGRYYGGHYGSYHGHWRPHYGRYWGPYYGGGHYGGYWDYYAAAEPYYDDTDAVSYCMQRFRTYDPNSGTYVGYDGYRHPCP
jgi:hypothetical protein